MKVVFAEADKMFRLLGEALSPSAEGPKFLADFFLTESDDPVGMMRSFSARRHVPSGIQLSFCRQPDDLKAMLRDADVLVIENTPILAEHLDQANSLKLIQIFGRQAPTIDAEACASKSIAVRSLDRQTNRQVAEHVIMMMLALARGLDESRAAMDRESPLPPSGWAYNWPACKGVKGLVGRVIGLVGLGQTGAMVAEYLRPFATTVLYTRRTRDREIEQRLGIEYTSLDELVSRSDVLSLHVPENAQTRNMFNAQLLARAKPGVLIVNTARGSLIDEPALVAALESGHVGGAALDVFVTEPLSRNHPLQKAKNVLLTPHLAAGTRDEAWLNIEIGPVIDSIVSALVQQAAPHAPQ